MPACGIRPRVADLAGGAYGMVQGAATHAVYAAGNRRYGIVDGHI